MLLTHEFINVALMVNSTITHQNSSNTCIFPMSMSQHAYDWELQIALHVESIANSKTTIKDTNAKKERKKGIAQTMKRMPVYSARAETREQRITRLDFYRNAPDEQLKANPLLHYSLNGHESSRRVHWGSHISSAMANS